jgi:transposase
MLTLNQRWDSTYNYILGIDVASTTLQLGLLQMSTQQYRGCQCSNDTAGFAQISRFLASEGATTANCIICLEATGVYSERVCQYLHSQGFAVACEAPQKVRRAMHASYKTDAIDARQIAEYAWRYGDQLRWWTPPQPVAQQLRALANVRELLLEQQRAADNMQRALARKAVDCPQAEAALCQHQEFLRRHLTELQQQMLQLLQQDDRLQAAHQLLVSIPGVGTLLSVQMLVLQQTLPQMQPRVVASYLGICPHAHQSGSSVLRPPRSRRSGPGICRRLLYLAAMCLCHNVARFRSYMQAKLLQGKPKRLILNNIANKLIRLICAVLNSGVAFDPNFMAAPRPT